MKSSYFVFSTSTADFSISSNFWPKLPSTFCFLLIIGLCCKYFMGYGLSRIQYLICCVGNIFIWLKKIWANISKLWTNISKIWTNISEIWANISKISDVFYWQYVHLTEFSRSFLEANIKAIKLKEQIQANKNCYKIEHISNLVFEILKRANISKIFFLQTGGLSILRFSPATRDHRWQNENKKKLREYKEYSKFY